MSTDSCPKCQAKVLPGMLHSCGGSDIYAPILMSIEEKLDQVVKLLGVQQSESAVIEEAKTTTSKSGSRAKTRETR